MFELRLHFKGRAFKGIVDGLNIGDESKSKLKNDFVVFGLSNWVWLCNLLKCKSALGCWKDYVVN